MFRFRVFLAGLILTSCSAGAVAQGEVAQGKQGYESFARKISEPREIPGAKTYMVAMRDGVRLATDVILPKTAKPGQRFPAVLIRTPYHRKGLVGEEAAKNVPGFGMAAVVQDMRGLYGSEGDEFPMFAGCGWGRIRDGYDTIEWVAKQPWCNGKVAMVGPSAMGITQTLTFPTQPPHLVCGFVMVACSDIYTQGATWGGVPRKAMAENWTADHTFDRRLLDLFRAHPYYDELWDNWNTEKRSHLVNVPALYYGGWYDIFTQGTINSFLTSQSNGGPNTKGKCRLILGPWDHNGLPKGLDYPGNARPKLALWALQWLTPHLTGVKTTASKDVKPVQYYVMGACGEEGAAGNVWREADSWPPKSEPVAFYFHKGGRLSVEKPVEDGASISYRYDPKDPVPTLGGGNLTIARGPMDQRPVEGRADVILFTTPVLTEPVEATGRIKVRLWASSSCTDTDFTAKLCDVYADGRSMIVCDGIIRARCRESLSKPKLIEPGRVYPFEIDLWSTSIIFNKGHRIRVAISSSNNPRFEPNANTGGPSGKGDKTIVAENTIYVDKTRGSHIILPRPLPEATASVGSERR
ncbi:MAG: CocE/NonD family hydrolase [Phycisphaerae bacterium]|nr:CocE/NonD family hydrolase [Phycisphaerae bacterium]